jgi:hypothetical protein
LKEEEEVEESAPENKMASLIKIDLLRGDILKRKMLQFLIDREAACLTRPPRSLSRAVLMYEREQMVDYLVAWTAITGRGHLEEKQAFLRDTYVVRLLRRPICTRNE